jgi:hypothetical protein
MAAGSRLVVSGPVDGSVRLAGNQLRVVAPVGADVVLAAPAASLHWENLARRHQREPRLALGDRSTRAPTRGGRHMTTPAGVVAEVPRMDTSDIEAPTNPLPQAERSAQILAPTHEGMRPLAAGESSPGTSFGAPGA